MRFINTFKILFLLWIVFPSFTFAFETILVPTEVIQDFLIPYSQEEKVAIERDRKNIRELCVLQANKGQKKLIYVATAGGPGASKTTILESYLKDHSGFIYVDPDQRALKFMINTYLQEMNNYTLSQSASYHNLLKDAYTKWRGASNYIANSILNEAYAEKFAIAHGTTSTTKHLESFYKKLKARGYRITLLLCSSSEENRLKAIAHREAEQCIVQSTHEDIVQKGQIFFENLPIYFRYADEIRFFWIEDFSQGWIEVGNYSKNNGLKKHHRDFEKFKSAYESFRQKHVSKKLPGFNDLLLKN